MEPELEPLSQPIAELLGQLPKPPAVAPQKAAVWQRVQSSAAGLNAAASASSTAAVAAGVKGAIGGKLLAVAAAALTAGLGGGVVVGRTVWAPAPQVVVKVERVEVPAPAPAPAVDEVAIPAPVVDAPAPAQTPRPHLRPSAVTHAPRAQERQLIEAIRTALLKRDGAAALELVLAHRRDFAKGQLAEERDSLEVQALLQRGDVEAARAAARRFSAAYPHSVFTLPEF